MDQGRSITEIPNGATQGLWLPGLWPSEEAIWFPSDVADGFSLCCF